MTNEQKIKCLFGHHDYKIPLRGYPLILICKYCKRFGHHKYYGVTYEYSEQGKLIHRGPVSVTSSLVRR